MNLFYVLQNIFGVFKNLLNMLFSVVLCLHGEYELESDSRIIWATEQICSLARSPHPCVKAGLLLSFLVQQLKTFTYLKWLWINNKWVNLRLSLGQLAYFFLWILWGFSSVSYSQQPSLMTIWGLRYGHTVLLYPKDFSVSVNGEDGNLSVWTASQLSSVGRRTWIVDCTLLRDWTGKALCDSSAYKNMFDIRDLSGDKFSFLLY